ncbi:hypothetical protein KH017_19695, partial [bacterium]|nr:hypothetical protein [bacterium]
QAHYYEAGNAVWRSNARRHHFSPGSNFFQSSTANIPLAMGLTGHTRMMGNSTRRPNDNS